MIARSLYLGGGSVTCGVDIQIERSNVGGKFWQVVVGVSLQDSKVESDAGGKVLERFGKPREDVGRVLDTMAV